MGQEDQTDEVIETLKAVQSQFPKLGKEDAVLIMAHGTPDPANAYYSVIQDRIHTLWYEKCIHLHSRRYSKS